MEDEFVCGIESYECQKCEKKFSEEDEPSKVVTQIEVIEPRKYKYTVEFFCPDCAKKS